MEYAAVFLLIIRLIRAAVYGLITCRKSEDIMPLVALAIAMCVPCEYATGIAVAVLCALDVAKGIRARNVCSAVQVACIFLLAGEMAYRYALIVAFALAVVAVVAFAVEGRDVALAIGLGVTAADICALLLDLGGAMRYFAFGSKNAIFFIFAMTIGELFDSIKFALFAQKTQYVSDIFTISHDKRAQRRSPLPLDLRAALLNQ